MKFTLTIDTSNEAFSGDPVWEIKRLLLRTIEGLEAHRRDAPIVDINGNTVGRWKLTGR